jgi:hypothetical protein
MGVEAKGKVGDLTGPGTSPSPSHAVAEPATGQLGPATLTEKERMQAHAIVSGPATVSAMTNARGWMIFVGIIISCVLLASVVVMFANFWT